MPDKPENLFNAYYYQVGCGRPYQRDEQWLQSFGAVAERIIQEIAPRTVLDAGCAMGFLVEGLRNRGVEAYGVDISPYAIEQVHESIRPYCWVGSVAEPFPQKYDLIISIEVLEHMPKADADRAVANICRHTDDVLFCSGFNDFREVTHTNLHPPEYWASLFAQQGFFRDVDFDATFLTSWTVRFRRRQEPFHRIIMDYERQIDRLIQENAAVRQVNQEQRAALEFKEQVVATLLRESTHYKDAFEQKEQEVEALRQADPSGAGLLAEKENALRTLNARLEAIEHSRVFRIARWLRSLIPLGGSQDHWRS